MSLRVCVCTWNVFMQQPQDEDLYPWLHLENDTDYADVYAIGLQEVPFDPQSILLDYYIRNDPWSRRLQAFLGSRGIVTVESVRMLGLLLLVAVKAEHLPFLRTRRKSFLRTALWGLLGIKGSVSIRFDLYGESFCFVNSHFTAGDEYVSYRNSAYQMTMDKIYFSNCKTTKIQDHRFQFFFGDFNYRLDELEVDVVKEHVKANELNFLKQYDQLVRSKNEGKCFQDFLEGDISFPPTYKYELKSNEFHNNSSKVRKPAWCDRVLWREQLSKENRINQLSYSSFMSYSSSDHKPVTAEFSLSLEHMLESEPVINFKFDTAYMPWTTEEDGVCIFYTKGYKTSSWDWIGLYRIDFRSPKDYYTYEWSMSGADETGEDGCMVLFDDIPEEPGFYQLCYYSRQLDCFLGISEPFEVHLQSDEPQEVACEIPPDVDAEPI